MNGAASSIYKEGKRVKYEFKCQYQLLFRHNLTYVKGDYSQIRHFFTFAYNLDLANIRSLCKILVIISIVYIVS